MVLTSEELGIANGIMHSIQNTSTYGYEVAVKGTVVDGIASLICGIIVLAIGIYATKKMYAWAKEKDSESDGFSYVVAFFGVIATLIVASLTISCIIHDPFMKIFAPEYTVIKQVLEIAAKTAT